MTTVPGEIALLASAVRFLTRLPVPQMAPPADDDLARAARYFPLAGALVGLLTGIVWMIASSYVPPMVAAGIAIGAGVLLTGALHEDGLSDCCDGLGGGATREKALDIMRDSRIGAYGAIGLVLSIGLRWAALASLAPWAGFAALVAAHAIGRGMIVVTLGYTGYARSEGAGQLVADGVRSWEGWTSVAVVLAISIIFCGWAGFSAAILAAIAGGVMLALLVRRLGGYTGDGLGAVEQVSEIAAMVALAGTLS